MFARRAIIAIGVYKIVKEEFVILAERERATDYPRFPISQGYAARRWTRRRSSWAMCTKIRDIAHLSSTRSEIVVPMRNEHRHVLGMMDVESDQLNAFGEEDRQFLERAGGLIAHCLH
jgi:GAF domain-containing protein